MLNAVAEYGRVRQFANTIMAVLLGLVFLAVGGYLEMRRVKYNVEVVASVRSVGRCTLDPARAPDKKGSGPSSPPMYTCTGVVLEYTDPDGNKQTAGPIVVRSARALNPGDTMSLYLNSKNFKDFSQQSDDSHMIGAIFMVSGLIVSVGSLMNLYVVTQSKTAAVIEGTGDVIGDVENVVAGVI